MFLITSRSVFTLRVDSMQRSAYGLNLRPENITSHVSNITRLYLRAFQIKLDFYRSELSVFKSSVHK